MIFTDFLLRINTSTEDEENDIAVYTIENINMAV